MNNLRAHSITKVLLEIDHLELMKNITTTYVAKDTLGTHSSHQQLLQKAHIRTH